MRPYVDQEALAGLLKSLSPIGSPFHELASGIEKGITAFNGRTATTQEEKVESLQKYVRELEALSPKNNINAQGWAAAATLILLMASHR